MQNLKQRFNPLSLLIFWILLMMVLTPIFMYISNIGASGGEQKPLITLGHMMVITIYGAPVVSVLSSLLYRKWFTRNWWFIFIIILTIITTVWLTGNS
jgi:cell division protein FtsW (lipid II flippase)